MVTTPGSGWGGAWLGLIERSRRFASSDLERGRSYAQHDWQFDVDVEPGQASALARSGPRLTYRAVVTAPVLSDDAWDRLLKIIAESSVRTAALFDRELDIDMIGEAAALDVKLFPAASNVKTSCDCSTIGSPCKHAAAVLYVLADAFDEDPFDLLLFRGMEADEVIRRVGELRADRDGVDQEPEEPGEGPTSSQTPPSPAAEPALIPAEMAWSRHPGPVPVSLNDPTNPPAEIDFGSNPPRSAPFTARGLNSLANEAATRAYDMIANGTPAFLGLTRTVDLARRSADAEGTSRWAEVVSASPFSGQALRQRAAAWRLAGQAGISVLDNVSDTVKVSDELQFRQDTAGAWFRFEKQAGRWTMTEGPLDEPGDSPPVSLAE